MNQKSLKDVLTCILRKLRIPVYVVGAEVVVTPLKFPCIIVKNTEKSRERGKHWICFYVLSEDTYQYFDSYGNELALYKDVKPPAGSLVKENCQVLQSSYTYLCGEYCLWFAFSRAVGITFEKFLSKFSSDVNHNDCLVRRFASSIPRIHPHNIYSNLHNYQSCLSRHLCPEYDKLFNKLRKLSQ